MGLLEKLKSFFGAGEERPVSGPGEPEITVEHEPAAESEHAVKGTGTVDEGDATEATEGTEPAGTEAADTVESADGADAVDEAVSAGIAGESDAAEATATAVEADTTEDTDTDSDTDAASGEAGVAEEPAVDSPSVQDIKGIGPTYSQRLDDAGIGTVADLAAADPEAVAEAAETSLSRAEGWVERARSR
jgi:predicted flap endonuclease-1-like 5' DNA nuclease